MCPLFIKLWYLLRFVAVSFISFPPVTVVVGLRWIKKIREFCLNIQLLIYLSFFRIENSSNGFLSADCFHLGFGLIKNMWLAQLDLLLMIQQQSCHPHFSSFSLLKKVIFFLFNTLVQLSGQRTLILLVVWDYIIHLEKVMFVLF